MNRYIKNSITIMVILVMIGMLGFTSFQRSETKNEKRMDNSNHEIQESIQQKEPIENIPKPSFQMQEQTPEKKIDSKRFLVLGVESLILSFLIIAWMMSNFHKKSWKEIWKNEDKITIGILSVLLFTTLLTCITYPIERREAKVEFQEEKATKKEDIENGDIIESKNINLSEYQTNITITQEGEYTFTGEFSNSIIINAPEEVKINLNNVTIENPTTATIINKTTNPLTIFLEENTTNVLSDGGSSEYDACIYSEGPLTIDGLGTLKVKGNQTEGEGIATETNDITMEGGIIYIESEDDGLNAGGNGAQITINGGYLYIKANGDGIDSNKNLVINGGVIFVAGSAKGGDAGIDTEDGFSIHGGTIIALGTGMLETPSSTTTQNTITFQLEKTIPSGTQITLANDSGNVILSFKAIEEFQTLIISSEKLSFGNYYLYEGGNISSNNTYEILTTGLLKEGTKITIQEQEQFKVSNNLNFYGQTRGIRK